MEPLIIDKTKHQTQQIIHSLFYNALNYYIADVNRHEVMDKLYEFFDKAEIAVISKHQLRYYQELERLSLETSKFNKE